ncbi:hypothetical protein [Exiguobacterium sp. s16]|uniref:hypothetical protein n=1 Tax=Exiguobacterium sp. s16 TaxID=2751237 RepID=UPI001BE9EF09|nr:hypothetical protein [Exiguobacterium sp. s16]
MKNDVLFKIHIEYNQLLKKFLSETENEPIKEITILNIIDEVTIFWRKKMTLIEYEIENGLFEEESLLLSGAVYLDVKENEHYFFTLFGENHIVDDPLIKLEVFFRNSENELLDNRLAGVFKNAYLDTLELTEKYMDKIYVLPISKMIKKNYNNSDSIDIFYWRFISTILNSKIKSVSEFLSRFSSLSEIEKELDEFILGNLIFVDEDDSNISLEDRCERYKMEFPQFNKLSNLEVFNVASYSFVAQIIDTLFVSSILGTTPYIRNNVSFRYFLLLKDTFIKDKEIKEMVEKSIVLYIAYKTIPESKLTKYSFDEFYNRVNRNNLMCNVLQKIKSNKIDIVYGKSSLTQQIINDEINSVY